MNGRYLYIYAHVNCCRMLETAEERVKLFKSGFTDKKIEMLYIKYNNIKIVLTSTIYELIEID
jgi:hypothetical protein